MIEWIELNEEDERFIDNPGFSEDQYPDPELDGFFWDELVGTLDYYEREYEAQRQADEYAYYLEQQQWLEDNQSWFHDF